MSLIDKLKTVAAGTLLAGAGLTSCESMSPQQLGGLILGGVAPYGKDPEAAQSASFLGQSLVAADAAERSKDEVSQNVYFGGNHRQPQELNQDAHTRRPKLPIIICNYAEDTNRDGEVDKFVGRKDEFYCRDGIEIWAKLPKISAKNELISEIWYGEQFTDNIIKEISEANSGRWLRLGCISEGTIRPGGDYKVVVFIDNEFFGERNFKFLEWDFSGLKKKN